MSKNKACGKHNLTILWRFTSTMYTAHTHTPSCLI